MNSALQYQSLESNCLFAKKDKDSNRLWIKVMDLKDNELGWINCDLAEIKPFTEEY